MIGPKRRIAAHAGFKAALVALLAVNGLLYTLHGTPGEAADALAWFALLVLFYAETTLALNALPAYVEPAIRYTRIAAAIAIAVAATDYVLAHAWLDALNSALWIAVVVLLEAQVRRPVLAARWRAPFQSAAVLLYSALAVVPFVWMTQREWFAAYDAVLWIAAFATIEVDLWPAAA